MNNGSGPHICIIVENQPVPFDRRVWQEARALCHAGYRVSVICPKGPQCEASRQTRDGIEIYRHRTWAGQGGLGYALEFACAFAAELYLAAKIYRRAPFHARGRQRVEQELNWQAQSEKFVAAFNQLLGNHTPHQNSPQVSQAPEVENKSV